MSYRAGIIGCGGIAGCHARAYRSDARMALVAGAEPKEDRRAKFQADFGVSVYASAQEMLGRERLCESYREIVGACADADVRLAIHAGWVPECALWNTASHLALFEAVPEPHNGVCLCAGSYHQTGDDVVEAVHRLGSRIHCVHFRHADALGGPCVEMLLGKGKVAFAAP